MKIYRAGRVNNLRSLTLFHAMARLGYEGLIVTSPAEVYVSVGFFDKTEEIIDVNRCRELNIPIIRREVGGGAVLLDQGQVFYQVVLRRSSPFLPFKIEEAYRKFSEPVIRVYRRFGVETAYRPINDIVVKGKGKKISGQGAADIGNSFVFVGNILLKFNTELMAQLFKVPEEKFRDKLFKTLEENMSWIEKETGRAPSYEEVEEAIVEEFSKILDLQEEEEVPEEAIRLADRLKEKFTSEDFLFEDTGRKHRSIKIREGVHVRVARRKARGGLLRAEVFIRDNSIEDVRIYGDFTLYPKDSLKELEKKLTGLTFTREDIRRVVVDFMDRVDFPGVEIDDLVNLIYGD